MEKKAKGGEGINPEFPSLVFLGTPDFAVPSLQKLVEAGAHILLVVTQPDRPSGRGKKVTPPPAKVLAEKLGIPVYQPERIREKSVVEHIRSFGAQCAAVVAYGQILPQSFLDAHPLGALNVHASLLPHYRGAAPIQRSLLAGDDVTGVSIMLLDAGMDTGPVFCQRELRVEEDEAFGSLHDRLARLGADLLCETLKGWKAGRIRPLPQEDALATCAPPIRKDELRIRWNQPARRVANVIHAFDPAPGAFAVFRGKRVKCFRASVLPWKEEGGKAGEVVGHAEKGLVVLGEDRQALAIGELQLEGQRRLSAAEFLRGHPITPGSCLE